MTIAIIFRDEKRAIRLVKVDMNSTPLRLRIRRTTTAEVGMNLRVRRLNCPLVYFGNERLREAKTQNESHVNGGNPWNEYTLEQLITITESEKNARLFYDRKTQQHNRSASLPVRVIWSNLD